MFGTISTALPPSGEKQFRKISQKLERWLYMSVFEVVKSQKGGVGSPIVVTYIHRLSSPPPPECMGDPMVGGKGWEVGVRGRGVKSNGEHRVGVGSPWRLEVMSGTGGGWVHREENGLLFKLGAVGC